MILVDANLLIYSLDSASPFHRQAQPWWDQQLSGTGRVALTWTTLQAFLRIVTNARISPSPIPIHEAIEIVESWLDHPCVFLLQPTSAHRHIFLNLVSSTQASGNLISDAALAALAIEHGCELYSADADFARFPGLKWRNPLLP